MKRFFHVCYEESRAAFHQWIARGDISLGYYVIGTIVLAPILPCVVAANVVRRIVK